MRLGVGVGVGVRVGVGLGLGMGMDVVEVGVGFPCDLILTTIALPKTGDVLITNVSWLLDTTEDAIKKASCGKIRPRNACNCPHLRSFFWMGFV